MIKNFILKPPARTPAMKNFINTSVSKSENPPDFEFLNEFKIPLWSVMIGSPEERRMITIVFSHGNSYDVPHIANLIITLFMGLTESFSIQLILWDYPGFSYSPLETSQFTEMERHLEVICINVLNGRLTGGDSTRPLFLVGHSIGASLQSSVLKNYEISSKIHGIYYIAPFSSLEDMSRNYTLGSLLYGPFVSRFNNLFNLVDNIKERAVLDVFMRCILCKNDGIISSGPDVLIKLENLFPETPWIKIIDGGHNSPIFEDRYRLWIVNDLNEFINDALCKDMIIEVA